MAKKWILPLATALIMVNLLPVLWRDSGVILHLWTAFTSAVIGVLLIAVSLRAVKPEPAVEPVPAQIPAPEPPPPTPKPAARAEAEVVALLALLQQEGRLIDFIKEDASQASDAQLGAAARVVHAGCRKILETHLSIQPIATEAEGTKVTLNAGYPAKDYRLLGTVGNQPPYSGTLLHPGWKAVTVKLPEVVRTEGDKEWLVIAPAEVEIKS